MISKIIEVSAGVITKNNKVLLAKRTEGYLNDLWEFPGGKIEDNETPRLAVIRELLEELNIAIEVHETLLVLEHQYPDKHVRLHFINCSIKQNSNNIINDLAVLEDLDNNNNIEWFTPNKFPFGDFCPADEIAAKNIPWNKILNSEES